MWGLDSSASSMRCSSRVGFSVWCVFQMLYSVCVGQFGFFMADSAPYICGSGWMIV